MKHLYYNMKTHKTCDKTFLRPQETVTFYMEASIS